MLRFPAGSRHMNFQTNKIVSGGYTPLGGASLASISVWVKVLAVVDNQKAPAILSGFYGSPFNITNSAEGPGSTIYDPLFSLKWAGNPSTTISYGFQGVTNQEYHLAMTFDGVNKVQKWYVNGVLVQTTTSYTSITNLENPSNTDLLLGSKESAPNANDGGGVDYIVDEPTLWNGYVLTQSDVTALVTRSSAPTAISPGDIEWTVPLDYSVPTNAATSDSQLSHAHAMVTKEGQPIGLAGHLAYTPPVSVPTLKIGYSGKVLVATMPADITAVTGNPTISINGGSAVTLTELIWDSGTTKQKFALYGLPTAVSNTDVVTLTASAAWLSTGSGGSLVTSSALSGQAVVNGAGQDYAPPPADAPKSTSLGMNFSSLNYWLPSNIYNNQAKVAGDWRAEDGSTWTLDSNGNVDSLTGTCYSVVSLCTSNGGQPAFPTGIWTLKYDSGGTLRLGGYNGSVATLLSTTTSGGTTTKVYSVTNTSNVILGVACYCDAAGATNVRVYPPGADTTGATTFHPTFLNRIKKYKCLRFMGLCQIQGNNLVDWSDWTPQSQYSYAQTLVNNRVSTLTSATSYSNADSYFDLTNAVGILLTTSAPHGYTDGQTITTGTIPLIATTGSTSTVNLSSFQFFIHVVNSTQFALRVSVPTGGATVTGTQAISGTVSVNLQSIMPIADIVNMVNSSPAGTDGWLSVPHLMTPTAQSSLFDYLAANTNAGHKWWIELSNEIWNYSGAFKQARYFYGIGQNGDATFTDASAYVRGYQAYAKLSAEMWARARASFTSASRAADVKCVCGGQFTSTGVQNQLLGYLSTNSYTPDAYAIAPYFDYGPETSTYRDISASFLESWTHEQLHDATQAWLVHGKFSTYLANHKSSLAGWFPSAELVCYEGGQQVGAAGTANSPTLSRYWGRSPRMYSTLMCYWGLLSAAGVSLHNHFILASAPGYQLASGDANWPLFTTCNMVPGKGDGTDGLYDNRTSMRYVSGVPTETIADLANVVSVIAYAVGKWQDIQPGSPRLLEIGAGSSTLKIGATY